MNRLTFFKAAYIFAMISKRTKYLRIFKYSLPSFNSTKELQCYRKHYWTLLIGPFASPVLGDVAHHRRRLSGAEPHPVLGSGRPAHRPLLLQQHVPSSSSHSTVRGQSAALLSSGRRRSCWLSGGSSEGGSTLKVPVVERKAFQSISFLSP